MFKCALPSLGAGMGGLADAAADGPADAHPERSGAIATPTPAAAAVASTRRREMCRSSDIGKCS
jgi:hypothetical protein